MTNVITKPYFRSGVYGVAKSISVTQTGVLILEIGYDETAVHLQPLQIRLKRVALSGNASQQGFAQFS